MDTTKIAAFASTLEAGSLSTAARRLGVRLSTLSRHIGELERTLGAPLLERTGRGVRPTAAGARFLVRARVILAEVERARAEIDGPPPKRLRLTVPPDLSRHFMPAIAAELVRRHPGLALDVVGDARVASLGEEAFDAALRLGAPSAPSAIATKVGAVSVHACTTTEALRGARGQIARIEAVRVQGVAPTIRGKHGGRAAELPLVGAVCLPTFDEAAELAARTDRLVVLPSFVALPHLEAGRLVTVPGWSLPSVALHVLRTPQHRASAVLRDLTTLVEGALEAFEARLT